MVTACKIKSAEFAITYLTTVPLTHYCRFDLVYLSVGEKDAVKRTEKEHRKGLEKDSEKAAVHASSKTGSVSPNS